MTTIIPGRPARPIQVETAGQPSVRVDAGGRIPPGGAAGQSLIKASGQDYATEWGNAVSSAAWGAITGTLASQADLQAALDAKQATLVSGTNIKTLNGSTILGSGDLVISASAAWGGITGTLSAQTDLQAALNARQPLATVLTNTTAAFTTAQETKLAGIATGATANATDAALRDRATHTGTQLASTISDFAAAVAATATVTANTAKVTNATHTGDASGGTVLTLATVNANVGSFGLAGSVAQFVVNAKGLITSAVNVAISIASTAISDSTAAGRAMLTAATAAAQTALLDVFTSGAKGLAPASGGGTANFLRADGTWAAPSGGGGGSPGGASGEVQYNNAGAFAGAADVEIEGGQLRLPVIATPATPAAAGVKLYASDRAGASRLAIVDPLGATVPIYPAGSPSRFYTFNDMTANLAGSEWALTFSGAGATVITIAPPDNTIGWARGNSGTTATGRAGIWANNAAILRFGAGAATWQGRIRHPTLSTATETFVARCGFIDSVTGESADGAFFRYTDAVNGGRWQAVTRNNNVETAADTGIAVVANATNILRVSVNAAGNSATFFINDVLVATIATNIPTAAGRETAYGITGNKTVGIVATAMWDCDYMLVEMNFGAR